MYVIRFIEKLDCICIQLKSRKKATILIQLSFTSYFSYDFTNSKHIPDD